MYKVAWIARYPGGMSRQEASDYWAGDHGPAMKEVSRGIRRALPALARVL